MKRLFTYILMAVLFIACNKEEPEYLKQILSDNGIKLEIQGDFNTTKVNDILELNFYDKFQHSRVYEQSNGNGQVEVYRRTKNKQSYISFSINIDGNKCPDASSIDLEFNLCPNIVDNNEKISVYGETNSSYSRPIEIHDFLYNRETGVMQFNFNYKCNNDLNHYLIKGVVDVKLFEIIDKNNRIAR